MVRVAREAARVSEWRPDADTPPETPDSLRRTVPAPRASMRSGVDIEVPRVARVRLIGLRAWHVLAIAWGVLLAATALIWRWLGR